MSKTKTHPLDNSHEPLTPDASSEGEPSQIAPPVVINEEDHQNNTGADLKRKQTKEIAPDTPRRSKRPRIAQDYQSLDDRADDPDMAGRDDKNMTPANRVYAMFCETQIAPDNPKTLTKAQRSPKWPQWEKAIQAKLDQLHKMGTWELVDPPKGQVPVGNKWVLTKKYDKQGYLQKFKACLVAKGYTQMPGMDYTDTYAPVVHLETIRTLLALAISENWEIQQMDIKGAYLNGRIKEEIYMKQPNGYDDGTNHLCRLIKSLYGLKQAGREWNIEFNQQLKSHGWNPSMVDPCAYFRKTTEGIEIIVVWVDDLLLFASNKELMAKMKSELQSIF